MSLALVATAGCYNHTYHVGAGAPTGTVVYDHWRHHWLGGLISPDHELILDEICPSGNATIDQEASFLNGLVSALTTGIYTPTTVKVRCMTGSADLDLEENEVERIVTDPGFIEWVGAVTPGLLEDARRAQQQLLDR